MTLESAHLWCGPHATPASCEALLMLCMVGLTPLFVLGFGLLIAWALINDPRPLRRRHRRGH